MTIQGMSFYDFAGKLVPGILLWSPFIPGDIGGMSLLWIIVAFVGFYLTGVVWNAAIRLLFCKLRLCNCMLLKARMSFLSSVAPANPTADSAPDLRKSVKSQYVEAYYKVTSNGFLGNISVLEAQENFLKSAWILEVYYLIIIICRLGSFALPSLGEAVLVALIIAIILIPIIWYYTQMKIYYLVWVAEYYAEKIKTNN